MKLDKRQLKHVIDTFDEDGIVITAFVTILVVVNLFFPGLVSALGIVAIISIWTEELRRIYRRQGYEIDTERKNLETELEKHKDQT